MVRLILDATIGPHVAERRSDFKAKAEKLKPDRRSLVERIADLRRSDPAEALLGLKLADPSMGSGHFLVSVVDRLADAVLLSMDEAAVIAQVDGAVEGYTSPLSDRIEAERAKIEGAAKTHGWLYRPEHLDDRHLIRRLVLKRSVYGVDRNKLAVELAKLSLWLHSFTVGAPLSFLDHHLRHGDSLFGAWVVDTEQIMSGVGRARAGGLTLHNAIASARGAAAGMARIEELADADIPQVRESMKVFETVEEATAPCAPSWTAGMPCFGCRRKRTAFPPLPTGNCAESWLGKPNRSASMQSMPGWKACAAILWLWPVGRPRRASPGPRGESWRF